MDQHAQRRLNEEAAGWLITLQDEPTRESEAGFRDWLKGSADHMQAFLEITAIDRDLDVMDGSRRVDLDALIAEVRAECGSQILRLKDTAPAAQAPRSTQRPMRWKIAIAASIAIAGVAAWTILSGSPEYATARGEQRTVKLKDGSMVHLNTRSRIEVTFTPDKREVRLLEGEAFFSVERDAARPFKVLTESATVQILGTQFNIYQRPGTVTVSVLSGRVGLSGEALGAGEEAEVRNDGRVFRHKDADVLKAVAWRQRQLDFDHAPLSYVVEQFNRYNDLQLVISDASLSSRELEGVFNADQPQALLDFLEQEPDLHIERRGDRVIIRRR